MVNEELEEIVYPEAGLEGVIVGKRMVEGRMSFVDVDIDIEVEVVFAGMLDVNK